MSPWTLRIRRRRQHCKRSGQPDIHGLEILDPTVVPQFLLLLVCLCRYVKCTR
jgi:hypothetical protein